MVVGIIPLADLGEEEEEERRGEGPKHPPTTITHRGSAIITIGTVVLGIGGPMMVKARGRRDGRWGGLAGEDA